ncbi:MAG: EAL domain-containing protein [Methylobacter sp.]|nr:EAL domain-containing protein [Candidatus Methylobacter titanis]
MKNLPKKLKKTLSSDEEIRRAALEALRRGDFDFALKAVERGEASIPEMVEDLKIYQAELEVQNDELRQAQFISNVAIVRFTKLFSFLPLPALVVDEMGVVSDCNEMAERCFMLNRKMFYNHFFPRLLKKEEHNRLRRAIEQAKDVGESIIYEVAMQPVDSPVFIADIHLSLLPSDVSSIPLFAVIVIDQTENLAQRKALEMSRRHFMAYFDASPVGMASASLSKNWLEVNNRLCEMLGYSREQLVNKTWLELTHPDDIEAELIYFERVLAKEIGGYAIDKRFICSDGSILEVHIAVNCVRDEADEVDYFVTIVKSIAARKKIERSLLIRDQELNTQTLNLRKRVKELEAIYAISRAAQRAETAQYFFDEVLRYLPDGMLYPHHVCINIDIDGNKVTSLACKQPVAYLSSQISVKEVSLGELIVGYTESHAALDIGPFYKEEQAFVNGAADLIGRYIERCEHEKERTLTLQRNSALLDLTAHADNLADDDFLQHVLDQAERLTQSNLAYAHFVNDDQNTITLGSWSSATLIKGDAGFNNSYPLSKVGAWADCLREKKWLIYNNCLAQTLPGAPAELFRHMVVPVMQADKIVMLVGVGNKTTDYYAGDVALLEMLANNYWTLLQKNQSQRRLELDAEVFRISREAVLITDIDAKIVSVNDAFTQITGYTEQEAIGQTPRLLKSGKQSEKFYKKMWQQITETGHWQGEVWNKRKDGELYPQWLGITAAKNNTGQVSEYIAIFMDITDHKLAQQRIEQLAYYDPLTRLANRTLLADHAKQAIALASRQHHLVGVLYLDLDRFKDINDSLGHAIGDKLLVDVANRLLSCVRDTDTVSRLGGDEFVVLLSHLDSADNVLNVAEKILRALAEIFEISQHFITVSCSIGACVYPNDGADFDILLQRADTAMYQAKSDGRNNCKFFTEEMNVRVQRGLRLKNDMRSALKNEEFYVEYQPQFVLKSRRIIGAEALVRWRHPELGNISPSDFIPIAEESGLIIDIGHFVMQQACHQAKRWHDQGHQLHIAVNVSYVQFVRNNLLQLVKDTLQETGLAAQFLELELTESILVSDPENVLSVVQALRDMGVFLSIDDFGTGYSSLSYLKRFAVHKLKIDQSFVRDILIDKDDAIIVSAIINLALSLEIQCIAEGVETAAQANKLQEMGCEQIQGYWLGRPLSVAQMCAMLGDNKSNAAVIESKP